MNHLSKNQNLVLKLCDKLSLGVPTNIPTRVHGGLLHLMWRLDTSKGSFAVKQLSKDIKLSEKVISSYELSEKIANSFLQEGLPAVSAIEFEERYLICFKDEAFLVFPWIDAHALDKDEISDKHAITIAKLLAEMHMINLRAPELTDPEFDTHTTDKLQKLIDKAISCNCSFAVDLDRNKDFIFEMNANYHKSISLLQKVCVVSHGDLDPKNVLWDQNEFPLLIDWESARKLNPTYEVINAALDWSGITTRHFRKEFFSQMVAAYINSGAKINELTLNAAFYGVFGNWLNWMVYNIERACKSGPADAEQREVGTQQVVQVLHTVKQLNNMMPELIDICAGALWP